ncbi:carbohydrate ABC transporter permease [Paenibacillus eucommiae]|uniref:Raffinose/stachyose/melibiose transport system permease protein n=1 Tax=Paenibacillus eucommiae TaxID=1355755 RepID=A0ABS4J9W9_9BACL|nr:carbohydrate ABC transporter permease [Paenibacillus eucommiae]MBP1996642.1 raffinose/stachyose/melibiose transport system permease protein [Paenibacillus eucommiae]
MSINLKKKKNAVVSHTILILFALTALLPLALVLLNSFKDQRSIVKNPLSWPQMWQFSNYVDAWKAAHFSTGFVNSLLLTGTTIIIVLLAASLAGYVLAGNRIKGTMLVTIYFMVAMTVPIQLFLFPLYFVMAKLGLLGNVFAVGFILAAVNMPLSIFLMRTFFVNIPVELEEAARMDGATTMQLISKVMIPLVRPGLLTVSIIVGISAWNEFLITSTFLQGQDSFTATLGFLSLNNTYNTNQGLMMAASVIMIGPLIIFFLGVQKYFIDGLVSGSVKG